MKKSTKRAADYPLIAWPKLRRVTTLEEAVKFIHRRADGAVRVLKDVDGLVVKAGVRLQMDEGQPVEVFADVYAEFARFDDDTELDESMNIRLTVQLHPCTTMQNVPTEILTHGVKRVQLMPTPLDKVRRFTRTEDFKVWIRQAANATGLHLGRVQLAELEAGVCTLVNALGRRREPFDQAMAKARAADQAAAQTRLEELRRHDLGLLSQYGANAVFDRAKRAGAATADCRAAVVEFRRRLAELGAVGLQAAEDFVRAEAGCTPTEAPLEGDGPADDPLREGGDHRG